MELSINNYPVEFQLEGEERVSDIVDSISNWARERELIFTEIHLDSEYFLLENVPDGPIADVSSINCIVLSKADVVFSTVDEGARYCDRITAFMNSAIEKSEISSKEKTEFMAGIDWINEVMKKVTSLMGLDIETVRVRDRLMGDYVKALSGLKEDIDKADGDGLLDVLRDRVTFFNEIKEVFRLLLVSEEMKMLIVQSIDSPDVILDSLKNIKEVIRDELKNLEETALAYQTGKDNEGSRGLERFIDFMYHYFRICYQVGPVFEVDISEIELDGVTLKEKNAELQDFLNETITILENNDIISLTDILEYEMLPAMENLEGYADLLVETITGAEKA